MLQCLQALHQRHGWPEVIDHHGQTRTHTEVESHSLQVLHPRPQVQRPYPSNSNAGRHNILPEECQ